jgi:hypothetical protein
MNRIDPDEDDDDEGVANGPGGDVSTATTTPATTTPATTTPVKKESKVNFVTPSKSSSKRSRQDDDVYPPGRQEPARSGHQAHQQAFLKYQQQQQQQQQQHPVQLNLKDQQRSRSTRAAAVAATAAVSAGTGNLILDPETGEMVPAGSDGEEDFEDEYDEDEDDVQIVQTSKPVLINLGQLKNSSSKNNLQVCVWSLVIFPFSTFNFISR